MVKQLKRVIAMFVTAILITSSFAGLTVGADDIVLPGMNIDGQRDVSANPRYSMYVDEKTLGLTIVDKVTGAYMESFTSYDDGLANKTWWGAMNSAVVLTMINGNDSTKQANTFNDNVRIKLNYTDYGFSADIYWNTYKLGLTLEVSLTNEGLTVRVPDESIKEDSDKYQIGTIALYPYMGTSYLDTKEGYMLVPDGNGALIYLDDKEGRYNAGYSAMIYGTDIGFDDSRVETLLWDRYKSINEAEQVIAPVFGIAHTADKIAYLGIVEDGAMRASIECMPNGVSIDYNRAYAKFIERRLYTQPTSNNSTAGSLHIAEADRSHSDLQVRYIFLPDEEATYAGMANAYREYLLSRGLLKKTDEGYKTRVDFLGSEREEWVIGTSAVVMTTVDDIRDIYSDLESRGVNDILSVYKGWQKGGLYNIPISDYKPDKNLGSKKDLQQLMADAESKGISMYLYADALRINPDEFNVTFNIVKRINKRKFAEDTYKEVYKSFNWQTPSRSDNRLNSFIRSANRNDINNFCVAGITDNIFSYNYSGNDYTRYDTAKSYLTTMTQTSAGNDIILEQPFAYLWSAADAFLDMPLYTSSYIIEDTFVPFLSLVLKGVVPVYSEYVNFEANKQEFFLKMVETGTYPSFYITKESSADLIYTNSRDVYSSEYSAYAETISGYADELSALNKKIAGATISRHTIEGKVTTVTYSNGVKVYINYGDTAAEADGMTIGAMSYVVVD